ncbi:MAG: hypothetical protein AAB403_11260 [Planctomycetota bacterium]
MREHLHQRQEQVQEPAGVRVLARHCLLLAAGLSALSYANPVSAQWCSEPSKPFCLGFGTPDDMCRISVEQYLRQEKDFRQCVVDEANAKVEESRNRANRIVEQWNCYARGSSFCL